LINELNLLYIAAAVLSFIDINMTFYLFNVTKKHGLSISETNPMINFIMKKLGYPMNLIVVVLIVQTMIFLLRMLNDIRIFYLLIGMLISVNIVHYGSVSLINKTIEHINKKNIKNYV